MRLLLQNKAEVNAKNAEGRTALHTAARTGNVEVTELLLEHHADVNVYTEDRRSPLHVALWRKHEELAKLLIESGSKVNIPDKDGWVPLHWAAHNNLVNSLDLLVKSDASLNIQSKIGNTPLYESILHNNLEFAEKILFYGADPNLKPCNVKSVMYSIYSLSSKSVKLRSYRYIEALLDHGYNLSEDQWLTSARWPRDTNRLISNLLCERSSTVHFLSKLCIFKIRAILNEVHGGRAIQKYVNVLPLPNVIKDLINIKTNL